MRSLETKHTRPRIDAVRALSLVVLAHVGVLGSQVATAAAPLPVTQQQDEDFEPYAFHLYNTQAARARAEEAAAHIAAGRWSEALAELQGLIEDHRGEVLGAARPQPKDARLPSQADVHAGAGNWAARQLFALPEEGRRLYRERFGPRADQALRRATAAADRGALGRVAQRWPLTEAAERAWWALGDLEIELGHTGDGLRAWARAAALHVGEPQGHTASPEEWKALRARIAEHVDEDDASAGALTRIDFALAAMDNDDLGEGLESSPKDEASFVRGPATGIAAESLAPRQLTRPSASDIGGWQSPFILPPGPYKDAPGASRLFPQRLGDTVFVNTSRSVHAIDAFDGRERWSYPSSRLGWDRMTSRRLREFEKAVDVHERIVTVAASRGVIVAPVQIPWKFEESDQYNDLSIIEVIPERRLIALDAVTGKELWNTLPPDGWTGDTGSFAERMTVVGPPLIVGARVLVPMAQLRGRIEFHLGCFDLQTGSVLWSAPLVTGQRTLNMFGRSNIEFSAPPPVVSGDTVVMLTQLGVVAAVDLFTGDTLWDTVYEQVPIRAPQYYAAGSIDNRWTNAPPLVHDGTVIAAPYDGRSLMALDLDTGAMLWSVLQSRISERARVPVRRSRNSIEGGLDVLLAADDRRIILGGSKIASIEFERGLRGGPPYARAWIWPLENSLSSQAGIPSVDRDRIFVPYRDGIATIDRATGRALEDIGTTLGRGNLLVSRGMVFATDGATVEARFQWRVMVDRARGLAKSGAATARDVSTLARLLLERAESLVSSGQDIDEAVDLTAEAAAAIRSFGGKLDPESTAGSNSLVPDLHRSLLLRAHAMRMRGDTVAARSALATALDLDAGSERELEALLLSHEIERNRDSRSRLRVLDRVLEDHGGTSIEIEADLGPGRWSASNSLSLVLEAARKRADSPPRPGESLDPWTDPWVSAPVASSTNLEPRKAASIENASTRRRTRISAGLFARIHQTDAARQLSSTEAAIGAELSALHAVLGESPDEALFQTTSSLWATARIQALRSLHPRSRALAQFESAASELLDRGLAEAGGSGSTETLESIPDLFPGSEAARRAAEARIEFALESGSPEDVASIVVGALDPAWHPARSTDRETILLVQLAHTLAKAGNPEFRAGLLKNLARYQPDTVVQTGTGATQGLAELSKAADLELATTLAHRLAPARPDFDGRITVKKSLEGDFAPVGAGVLEVDGEAPRAIALFASKYELMVMPSGRGGEPLWQRDVSLGLSASTRADRVAISGSRVVVAERDRVTCLDVGTGDVLWTIEPDDRRIGRILVDGGVVVVATDTITTREHAEVHGYDLARGIELWRLNPIGGRYHPAMKVGGGRLVLLPERSTRAAVHDLYTGHALAGIKTGRIKSTRIAEASWIADDRLLIPYIDSARSNETPNAIVAFELDDGRLAWQVDLDRHAGGLQNLLGIIEMPISRDSDEVVRLALLAKVAKDRSSNGLTVPSFGIHVLNERLGALDQRPLTTVNDNSRLMGVVLRRRVVLDVPLLLCIESGRAGAAPIFRAIDPRYGELWKARAVRTLLVKGADKLSPPALGDGVLAVMVREEFGNARGAEAKLMFLDSASGTHVETRPLETGPTPSGWRHIQAFGGSLTVTGARAMKVLEGAPR